MIATQKTSISLAIPLWEQLQQFSNKSAVIAEALELFFSKKEALRSAEDVYWQKVESSLRGEDNEYISLNPNAEKITKNLLDDTLWK